MSTPPTLLSLFLERSAQASERAALVLCAADGQRTLTWQTIDAESRRLAVGLQRLGVEPGARVVQVSENRYEWILADLAIQLAQAVHVPAHTALTAEPLAQLIRHCGARLVLLSNAEQATKLARCADQLPADCRYVVYDRCSAVIGRHDVPTRAEITPRALPPTEADRIARDALDGLRPDSLATILYTSGTTGAPKGVMLTQGNLAFNALATPHGTGESPDDLKLCFLPLSHSYARTCDVSIWIACGNRLALAESRETVIRDCALVQPTWLNGVPYFFDKVRRQLVAAGCDTAPHALREILGGRIRSCQCGGAPLTPETFDFYWAHGVPLFPGYGLTEASPVVSVSHPQAVQSAAVGRPLPGIEVQVAADGEILTRGPHVMTGYWNDPQATAETLGDGWLHTGDLGRLDADGLLYITGRKKEMLVTTGGKKVAPAQLESLLATEPLIAQVCVVGEGRDYVSALIVPHRAAVQRALQAHDPQQTWDETSLAHPLVQGLFADCLARRLAGLSRYEQVRRFALLDEPFTVESGELTPKLSLRREVIAARRRAVIDGLYARAAKAP